MHFQMQSFLNTVLFLLIFSWPFYLVLTAHSVVTTPVLDTTSLNIIILNHLSIKIWKTKEKFVEYSFGWENQLSGTEIKIKIVSFLLPIVYFIEYF